MAGTFKFELVSPESILISADAEQVIVPGMEGQFTVFAGHAPVISTLRPGVLDAQVEGGRRRVFVRGGFAEVEPERLTVLAQHLLDLDALDAGQLAHELESAERMLAEAKDDTTRMVAGEAVEQLKALRP
ncbi:MAG: F0F1 ATP synthase subunit epsilon [Bacteroidota bacterium]|jgi:F-type H+-transporting ATPase subunit epsilon